MTPITTDIADLVSRFGKIYDQCKCWPETSDDGVFALIKLRNIAHDELKPALETANRRIEELEAALVDARLFVDLLRTHWSNWHDDPEQVAEADDCLRRIDATLQPKEQQP